MGRGRGDRGTSCCDQLLGPALGLRWDRPRAGARSPQDVPHGNLAGDKPDLWESRQGGQGSAQRKEIHQPCGLSCPSALTPTKS